jgi:hypothetical protein
MQIRIDREELDEAIFAAAQDVMGAVTGWTTRQKLTVTLNMTNALMARVDLLIKTTEKSATASRAAKKRWAKTGDFKPGESAGQNSTARRRRPSAAELAAQQPELPINTPAPADSGMQPAPFGSTNNEPRI